jgi:hypothetical protein
MPSISHNLVSNGRNFAIVMSLTDGHSVASFEIELDQQERRLFFARVINISPSPLREC